MIDISEDRQSAYTVAELAELFNVHRDTVLEWAKAGAMGSFRTPGEGGHGHWRFLAHKVREQMRGQSAQHDQREPPASPHVASEAAPAPRRADPADVPRSPEGSPSGCPAFDHGDCECATPCVRRSGPYADLA